MQKRVFLGYSTPVLPSIVNHLLLEKDSLAQSLVIVPTTQSGRLLRESLAAATTALLAPRVSTPGALLKVNHPRLPPKWIEKIAWSQSIENLTSTNAKTLRGLFPSSPELAQTTGEAALAIASDLANLSASLSEHNHDFKSASAILRETPEASRWNTLAELQTSFENVLADWSYISSAAAQRNHLKLPECQHIFLAGVTELPKLLVNSLETFPANITILIGAPGSKAAHFSKWGIPTDAWKTEKLPSHTRSHIAANPAEQAKLAVKLAAQSKANSAQFAIGSPDDTVGTTLAKTFTENGWHAFHSAARSPLPGLVRWLTAWRDWISEPSVPHFATLLELPEADNLADGQRAVAAKSLNNLRDKHPFSDIKTIAKLAATHNRQLAQTIKNLLNERLNFQNEAFGHALQNHLTQLNLNDTKTDRQTDAILTFLKDATPLFSKIQRKACFWLTILISEIPENPPEPPANRAIDIQGWLELLFEPGPHLIIAGMNENNVPSRPGGEPWLSENLRSTLGLGTTAQRHSRDTYLLHAMLESRKTNGSTNLICGKNNHTADALLPSRLLLNVTDPELVPTVQNLFREMEPPEANLAWSNNWKWQVPEKTPSNSIGVTALSTYLSCPFRYYLKHVLRMETPSPERAEMNPRDFGTLTHAILQHWAEQDSTSTETCTTKINKALKKATSEVIGNAFSGKIPLPVRIQLESLAQRLTWFAGLQAEIAADGWETIETEKRFEIPILNMKIKGTIDRIDRHRDSGQLRVIDYKTGKPRNIVSAHARKQIASSKTPEHLQNIPAAQLNIPDKTGKPKPHLWKNLQLPLYVESLRSTHEIFPTPAYIFLGKTKKDTQTLPWNGYSTSVHEPAIDCAKWILNQIQQKKFWPPAENVEHDSFEVLAAQQTLESQCENPTAP